MSLSHLSDEVLAVILDFYSDMVVSLWLCGNTILNHRLSRCCRTFRSPPEVQNAYMWPRILANLHGLILVDFCVQNMAEPLEKVSSEIQKLPSSLKSLRVGFCDAFCVFYQAEHRSSSDFTVSSKKRKKKQRDRPSLWNIGLKFPGLTHLGIGPSAKNLQMKIHSSDLLMLPPSLQVLDLHSVILEDGDFSTLPRGLKSLHILRSSTNPAKLVDLPPSLTELRGLEFNSIDQIRALPPTLTSRIHLELPATTNAELFTPDAFPPDLHSLYLGEISAHRLWLSPPPCLVELAIHNFIFSPEQIAALPRTITSLTQFTSSSMIALRPMAVTEARSLWPPLRELQFTYVRGASLNLDDIKNLPRSLTILGPVDFGMRTEDRGNSIFSSEWPSSLIELSFHKYSRNFGPGSLLDLLPEPFRSNILGDRKIEHLPDPLASPLPSGLQKLRIIERFSYAPLFQSELRAIPAELRELKLHTLESHVIALLPRGLQSLSADQFVGSCPEDAFANLPPGLTSLDIDLLRADWISTAPSSFAYFPTSLKKLTLRAGFISQRVLEKLPLHIQHLEAPLQPPTFLLQSASLEYSSSELAPQCLIHQSSPPPFLGIIHVRWLRWLSHHVQCDLALKMAIRACWPPSELLPVSLLQM